MSPDPVLPSLFLPCSLPQLLSAAAGGGLEPSPARRFRGASPHRLLSYAKESPVADSFAHGTLRSSTSLRFVSVASECCRAGSKSHLRWQCQWLTQARRTADD